MRKMMSFMAVASMLMIFAGCSYSVDPPAGLKATSTPVTLTWGSVSWATGYNVYRGTASGGISSKTLIAHDLTVLTLTDTSVIPGKTYYYQVTATNSYGGSGGSNEVAAADGTLLGGSIRGKTLSLSKTVSTFAGFANFSGATDATGTLAEFKNPRGIATDGSNLYVADKNNHTIRKIVISSGAVTTIAGQAGNSGSDDGTGTEATFNFPDGVTTDGTSLYIADQVNGTIRQLVISTGIVTTIGGKAGDLRFADGPRAEARFLEPTDITTDGANLFITDFSSNIIRRMVISTGVVTTIAGTYGVPGSSDGTGAAASFDGPLGITTDGTNLYVADYFNGTIRKIVISTGVVTTIAGTSGVTGAADGTGVAASFTGPDGITTDGTNLYVTDFENETIRKIVISTGVVTTIAGKNGFYGAINGVGTAAVFHRPTNITTDGTSLYVSDSKNHIIRQIK
jgi:hypothetical protein